MSFSFILLFLSLNKTLVINQFTDFLSSMKILRLNSNLKRPFKDLLQSIHLQYEN